MDDFEEYIRQGEPDSKQRAYAWRTAIGLQAVDGLTTSDYLQDTARRNIEGEIDIKEAQRLIKSYYQSKTVRTADDNGKEEADIVSSHIAEILGEQSFSFSVVGITSIHRRLFEGVFKFAGKIRDYDITKKEWVLRGDTVLYGNAADLRRALEYDLQMEKDFSYKGLTMTEVINHIAKFVSGLWQIHAFGEGNTRTTAVFAVKYLRSLGFDVNNDLFAKKSWYFRNALVRANYHNYAKGIDYEPKYLQLFFRNLLLGEQNELHNRYMLINPPKEWTIEEDKQTGQATGQAGQVPDRMKPSSEFIARLVKSMAGDELSVKLMMQRLELKGRDNFLNTYLNPAVKEGFVALLYPDKPRHPRQKYLLTVKGLALLSTLK